MKDLINPFAVFTILASLFLIAVTGSTIYVNNAVTVGDGTQANPYSSLTQALGAASGSSSIDAIVLASGQTFSDLSQSSLLTTNLAITSSSSEPAQITFLSNAQLTFSSGVFTFSSVTLLFSNSGLSSSCSIQVANGADLVLSQVSISANTTTSQLMPLICVNDSSSMTISDSSTFSSINTSQNPPLIEVYDFSSLKIDVASAPNLKLLGSASLIRANLSSSVTIQSISISSAVIGANAFAIYDSSLVINNATVTNVQINSGSFISLVASTEQANLTITASQFNTVFSSNTAVFLNSNGNISNIALSSLSIGQITLLAGFANIQSLGSQFKMSAVTMLTINSIIWFNINSASLLEVANCQFGNLSSDFGSAFVINNVYLGNFTSSVFNGLLASQYPSAMLISGTNSTLNTIITQIGPVSFSQGFYLTNCVFENLNGYYTDEAYLGGPMYMSVDTPVQVNNAIFQNNSYQYSGNPAVVYAAPCIMINSYYTQVLINNSVFTGNRARAFGSCIWAFGGSLVIENSIISKNTPIINITAGDDPVYGSALGAGGGLLATVGALVVRNTTFLQNLKYTGGDVAFITTSHADTIFITRNYIFDGCSFIGSSALTGGNIGVGSIFNLSITISNSMFIGTTYGTGGAVGSEIIQNSTLYLINNTFMNLVGTTGGVVMHASSSAGQFIQIINCTIANIQNTLGGSSIFLFTGTTLMVQNTVFINITEYYAGSVLYSTSSQVTMDNCTYSYGFATAGGIYLTAGSTLKITNSVFSNLETLYDGALFLVVGSSTLNAVNITATNILTDVSGGVVTVMDSSNASFFNLSVFGVQGVIGALFYVDQASNLVLDTAMISTVQAQVSGVYVSGLSFITLRNVNAQTFLGGIFLSLTNSSLIVNDFGFKLAQCNSQTSVCGIYLESTNSANISGYHVQYMNTSGTYGALGLSGSTVTISLSSFSYVSSPSNGSCIVMMTNANLSVVSSTFTNSLGSCVHTQGGGNILTVQNSTFNQSDSTFITYSTSGNQNQQKPFIECQDYTDLTIYNCSFSNNYVSSNGGALMLTNSDPSYPSIITIDKNTTFSANTAVNKGGAISLTNTKGNISNTNFVNNYAELSGGALHYNSSVTNAVTFASNTFQNNSAVVSGGVLFIEDGQLSYHDSGSVFSANQAGSFGSEVASNAVRLGALITNTQTGATLYNYSVLGSIPPPLEIESAVTTPYNFTFVALDQFEQITTSLSQVQVTLNIQRIGSASGQVDNYTVTPLIDSIKEFYFSSGVISFSDLIASSIVPDTLQLQVSAPLNTFTKPTTFSYYSFESDVNGSYVYSLELDVRDCMLGESKVTETDSQYCNACPSGTYSFNASDGICSKCPDSATCYGGANTSVLSGFWRENNYSVDIYKCLVEGACPQGTGYICGLGYEGPLCQTCSESNRTYKSAGGQCWACPKYTISSPVFVLAAMAYIAYFAFNIWVNVKAESDQMVQIKGYLRILNIFFQLYSIAINGEFPAPERLIYLYDVLSVAEASRCADIFDCSFVNSSYPFMYLKAVFLCLLPLMCIGFFAIWLGILKLFKKTLNLRSLIRISSQTLLYLLVPGLTKQLLLSLNCTSIGNQSVLSFSYAFECNENRYKLLKYVFILPCFFVWCVIIPVWTFVSTHMKIKKAAGDNRDSKLLKLRLQLYKREQLHWDAIIYAKLFGLGVISAFLGIDYYNKAVLNLGVLGISFYLIESCRPYRSPQFNFLAIFELSLAIFTILGVIYSTNLTILNNNLATVAFYVILMANIAFIIICAYLFIQSIRNKPNKRSKIYEIKIINDVRLADDESNQFKVNTDLKMEDKFADFSNDSKDLRNTPISPLSSHKAMQISLDLTPKPTKEYERRDRV